MTTTPLIDTREGLSKLVRKLRGQEFVAVDTEFVREHTYYPRLCLVQLATHTTAACVDAIALDDLSSLTSVLLDATITKVLHAARQDLEIFVQLTGRAPGPLFDTQIAADLCGLGDQGSLAAIASQLLSVELDKSHTRTDWSRRPLSEQQLQYALDDARYLIPIYEELSEQLREQGRTSWLEEDCERLINPALYTVEPAMAWKRLGGLGALSGPQYHAARLLAQWREDRAIDLDRPRGWILRDDVLLRIATALPDSENALEKIKGLPRPLFRKASKLLDIVSAAQRCEDPVPDLPAPLSPQQRKRVIALMDRVRRVAADIGVSAATLASRRDVTAVVRRDPNAAPLRGWRREIIGEQLLAGIGD
ncbi:MAG: ribonuclease D [Gammaproteobacteria bacterium]|nr:ribonuclease D [Gammaproteobacteria bacterium]MDH3767028.1 ribonuclease D [Gammaproteobacteria bacterium]